MATLEGVTASVPARPEALAEGPGAYQAPRRALRPPVGHRPLAGPWTRGGDGGARRSASSDDVPSLITRSWSATIASLGGSFARSLAVAASGAGYGSAGNM